MKQPALRILSAWLPIALLAAAVSTELAGCAAAAWTAAQFAPPTKVSALYRLPKDCKALVFVDDYLSEVGYEPIKGLLAEGVNERLAKEQLVASTVTYRNLADLAAARGTFNDLAVSQVGAELGAEVVLYVHIDTFSTKDLPESPLWHGQFRVTVRVVDVKTGRLWPTDRPDGYAVEPVEMPSSDNPLP